MDYQIENVYVVTEKMLQQTYQKFYGRISVIRFTLMSIFGLTFVVLGIFLEKSFYYWMSPIYNAVAVWYLILPCRLAKKEYKKTLKYHDGNIPETVVRFGDAITLTQGDCVHTLPYNKLKKVCVLKDCLLLYNEMGGAHLIARDGFTKGSMQEMFTLLRAKSPQAKMPDWQW